MGSVFAVGTTKAAPTTKEIAKSEGKISDMVHLKDHDAVRAVTCNSEDLDFDPTKDVAPCDALSGEATDGNEAMHKLRSRKKQPRLSPFPGVDLEFLQSETGLTDLHFNLKFKNLLGDSSTVRMLQSRSDATAEEPETQWHISWGFTGEGWSFSFSCFCDWGQCQM